MTAGGSPTLAEFAPVQVAVVQESRYRFEVSYPGTTLSPLTVDEPTPIGTGSGPDPALALAGALGHCLSSTLFNSLERARVRASPIRTSVIVTFARNERGRKRIAGLAVQIQCAPVDEADRARFDRCVAIFEDYCTVTGSVREGVRVSTEVQPPPAPRPAENGP